MLGVTQLAWRSKLKQGTFHACMLGLEDHLPVSSFSWLYEQACNCSHGSRWPIEASRVGGQDGSRAGTVDWQHGTSLPDLQQGAVIKLKLHGNALQTPAMQEREEFWRAPLLAGRRWRCRQAPPLAQIGSSGMHQTSGALLGECAADRGGHDTKQGLSRDGTYAHSLHLNFSSLNPKNESDGAVYMFRALGAAS